MESDLKQIPGYPSYLAGRDGTIWSLKRKGGNDRGAGRLGAPRKLKLFRRVTGYVMATLDIGGKVVSRQVHRLILLTFVGEPKPGQHGCHFPDTNPSNNTVGNLRWDSPSENAKDKFRHLCGLPSKKCTTCGSIKPKSEFYADKRNGDGLKAECKPCHCRTSIATRDIEKKRAYNREFMRRARKM